MKATTKQKFAETEKREQKEIYNIMLRIYELEEVNHLVEQHLEESQFLYRSLMRDAEKLIDKIELEEEDVDKKIKAKRRDTKQWFLSRVQKVQEKIEARRLLRLKKKPNETKKDA
jgi:hypothetical protein